MRGDQCSPQPTLEGTQNGRSLSRSFVVYFSAYVGAFTTFVYQFGLSVFWGHGVLEPLSEVLLSSAFVAIMGSMLGLIAAGAYYVARWFLKLD
jgi:hypothetical protein